MIIAILLFILSVVNLYFGNKVKVKKLGNVLSGFDPEKDDVNYVSELLGNTLKRIGNCGIIIVGVYLILMSKVSSVMILILYSTMIVLFTVNLVFKTDKHRRNNLKEAK